MVSTVENLLKNELIQHSEVVIKLRPDKLMSNDEFFDFCQKFDDERVERTAEGEIIIMPSCGFVTSNKNARLVRRLDEWAERDGRGFITDSNGGFILPNGANRAPDAAWFLKERIAKLNQNQIEKILPLCPDFVVELTSPTDSLKETREKMVEYIENGARLGWLIHRKTRQVFVYRQNGEVEVLDDVESVSGEFVLNGFELDLREIW